jgi:selenocysteine lyase/cysteine desulfurase
MSDPRPAFDLAAWRREIPSLDARIHLANCSHAPQSNRVRAAADAYLDGWRRDGMDWDRWMADVDAARAAFARLIGASEEEVAVTTSVSAATASLASAQDFGDGRDGVVASGAEFPAVGHVWRAHERHGARLSWVPVTDGRIEPEAYEPFIDDRTRVVSACHGFYRNGFKQDVAAIAARAHAHGAIIYVDAYQTLGTCRLDVRALGIDVLAAGALKYLMAVPGIAFLYVRSELVERLEPALTGWFGRANPFAFDPKTLDWSASARRFETGTPPVLAACMARAGLEIIEDVGLDAIEAWTGALQRRLIEGGLERGLAIDGTTDPARKAPSTAFRCPGDAHAVEEALRDRRILASARGDVIRLAPHFFNTLDEIDRALDALVEVFDEAPA